MSAPFGNDQHECNDCGRSYHSDFMELIGDRWYCELCEPIEHVDAYIKQQWAKKEIK